MTFGKLKRTLQRASGIPVEYIRLFFQEGLLADEGYLTDVAYSSEIELEMQIEEAVEEGDYGGEALALVDRRGEQGADVGEPIPPPPPYPPQRQQQQQLQLPEPQQQEP
jgi:hypothetical protein